MSGGCVWEPFTITLSEYEELVRKLQGWGLSYVPAPEWVRDKIDWHIWKFEYEVDVPSEEHYRLWREHDRWMRLTEQARKDGDREQALSCHLKAVESGQRLARFLEPYIRKYRNMKRQ